MRLTTGLDSVVLAVLALVVAMGFTDLLFPPNGVATGLGELNSTFGMGVVMEAMWRSGLD